MSWDLSFEGHVYSQELSAWARSRPGFQWEGIDLTPNDPMELAWRNPKTGVYFHLDLREGRLHLDVNFNRPTFFGHEAVQAAVSVAKALGLKTIDPQASGQPEDPDADALIASYVKGNDWAVGTSGMLGGRRPHLDREASLGWWRWMNDYDEHVRRYGDDVFVPSKIFLLVRKGTDAILPTVAWPDGIPILLPKWRLGGFILGKDDGPQTWAEAGPILDALRPHLIEKPEGWLLEERNMEKARGILLDVEPIPTSAMRSIAPDQFTDR